MEDYCRKKLVASVSLKESGQRFGTPNQKEVEKQKAELNAVLPSLIS